MNSTGTPNYTHLVNAFGFSRSSGQDLYDRMGAQFGYRDENTGFLYLLGHRFYDAQFGQFITRDPMGYGGGVNLYGYTGNDPVNRRDPNGFWSLTIGVSGTLVFGLPIGIGGSAGAGIVIGDGGVGVYGNIICGVGFGIVGSVGANGGYSSAPQPSGFHGGPIYGWGGTVDLGGGGSLGYSSPFPGSGGNGGISGWKGGPSLGGGIGGYGGMGVGGTAVIPIPIGSFPPFPGTPGGQSIPTTSGGGSGPSSGGFAGNPTLLAPL